MAKIRNQKLDKSVFGGHETVRVAAVQAPQIVFNKEKSIEVACQRIKEAGANGAKLVAFSETYIPTYPAYYTGGFSNQIDEWAVWNVALQDHSIAIPSEDTEIIGKACRDAGVYCVMGVNELDDQAGSRTLYNTQILFGPDGSILGRHRKLMPTYTERTYWGRGDGSDLNVYQTDIGRIGSLICWEHHTILVRAAQMLMGEEFHIANWPGTWSFGHKKENGERHAQVLEGATDKSGSTGDSLFAAREYAFESGSFVISVAGLLRKQDFEPEFKQFIDSPFMNFSWAVGGAAIINPFGEFIAGPVYNDDTIVYADCHANEIKAAKVVFDGLGHYSRPDAVQILLHDHEQKNLLRSSKGLSYQDLKNISESTEVPLQKLEKVLEKIESKLSKPKTNVTI
ncbi:carbon-nitrogen hydrolase family protein [Bacillus smithii]|uniref:carbon-nitrogen hydrolase family protein n=1 Tax=Bacillus smithii TaxID=1479 RepID=UPI0030C9C510